eukprot:gene15103-16661_t
MSELSPEEIRRRRLARLGGSLEASPSTPSLSAAISSSPMLPSSAASSPMDITLPQPRINLAANRLNVDAKNATSPSSASVLYGITPPTFGTVDSGLGPSQPMDVDSEDGEKGEKRTSQSMLTPPTDSRFKRQYVTGDKEHVKNSPVSELESFITSVCKIFNVFFRTPLIKENAIDMTMLADLVYKDECIVCELQFEDLMQQIVMEQLLNAPNENNTKQSFDQSLSPSDSFDAKLPGELSSKNSVSSLPSEEIDEKSTSNQTDNVSTLLEDRTSREMFYKRKLRYLISCYDRVGIEERVHSKRSDNSKWRDLLNSARRICISSTLFISEGGLEDDPDDNPCALLLLPFFLEEREIFPAGFLAQLVQTADQDGRLDKVFGPILMGLSDRIKSCSLVEKTFEAPLLVLSELCEIKLPQSRRPICSLITRLPSWNPGALSNAAAKELQSLSFFGPFLRLSVFADDDPRVADKYFANGKPSADHVGLVRKTLRVGLQFVRAELFKIMHSLLLCQESREACLLYLAEILNRNSKKSQLQADEKLLSDDGLMINVLTILQQHCVKVRMDKVDNFYPFHPKCKLDMSQTSCIKATKEEFDQWKSEIGAWSEVKFPTECFFFTFHCHHVSIIPCFRKYAQRLRTTRDINRLVNELETRESEWKGTPLAARNRAVLKKWKTQIKKLMKQEASAEVVIMDDDLLRRCLAFYGAASNWLLQLATGQELDNLTLPLPEQVVLCFGSLPDYFIEDIVEFILFADM